MKSFDFDASLNRYAKKWFECNSPDESQIEESAARLYDEWCALPVQELGGVTPLDYFKGLGDDALFELWLSETKKSRVPAILLDVLCVRKTLAPRLCAVVNKGVPGELTETAMQLLQEMSDTQVYDDYFGWILDKDADEDLCLHAVEILQEDAAAIKDKLDAALQKADNDAVKCRLADIVVYAPPTERGYKLLCELFLSGADTPLYACYLGKYGLDKAIGVLKSSAIDCDYIAFMEITNAVERLGGEMDIRRNFDGDPAFRRIKSSTKSLFGTGAADITGKEGAGHKKEADKCKDGDCHCDDDDDCDCDDACDCDGENCSCHDDDQDGGCHDKACGCRQDDGDKCAPSNKKKNKK